MITSGRAYNNIIKELELIEDLSERERLKHLVDIFPTVAYGAIWEEYIDKDNAFSLQFIIDAMDANFKVNKENLS